MPTYSQCQRKPYSAQAIAPAVIKVPRQAFIAAKGIELERGIPVSCGHVVVAESHPAMLEGIRRMIETMTDSVIMVADEPSLIQAIHKTKPDLVIANLSFQVSGATNVIRLIKRDHPAIKVIAVSIHDDPAALSEAVEAGAEGVVLKRRAAVELIPAIRAVCQERRYVPTVNTGDNDQGGR